MSEYEFRQGDLLSAFKTYINELNGLEPAKRRIAIAVLLASVVDRVRLLNSNDDTLPPIAESSMGSTDASADFLAALIRVIDFPKSSLPALSESLTDEVGGSAAAFSACIDFVADGSGRVSFNIGHTPSLEGENLLDLDTQDIAPLSEIDAHDTTEGSFLSAARAADLLGVAKSTITRRIDKNEMIGFCAFTNKLQIPAEQFQDGTVVPGIPQVLAMFNEETVEGETYADHKRAWRFLDTVVYPGSLSPRPIDRLREGLRNRTSDDALAELNHVKESLDYGDHI